MSRPNSYQRRIDHLKARIANLEYATKYSRDCLLSLLESDVNVNAKWVVEKVRFLNKTIEAE